MEGESPDDGAVRGEVAPEAVGPFGTALASPPPIPTGQRAQNPNFSWLAVIVTVVVAGLSVTLFGLVHGGVEQRNNALVRNDTNQAVMLLESSLQTLASHLNALGAATVDSGDQSSVFENQAKPLLTNGDSVALVDVRDAGAPTVLLAAGTDLQPGQVLTGALASAAQQAGPMLSGSSVVDSGGKSWLVFAESPVAISSGTSVVEIVHLNPSKMTTTARGPFSQLDIALYASPSPRPQELVLSTVGRRPLPQPTVSVPFKVGSLTWEVVGAANTPLVGGAALVAPWMVLGVGLALSLTLMVIVEELVRRQRLTAKEVAKREAELSEAHRTLVRQERLSAVGEMAAVLGHDLRNPLAATINSLFLARKTMLERISPDAHNHLDRAERAAYRAASMADDLMAYVKETEPNLTTLDLREVVDEALEWAPPPPNTTLVRPRSGVPLDADKEQMVRILTNLVVNAYQAMPDGGSVTIGGREVDGFTVVTVKDSGEGLTDDATKRLFEPFATTKATGTGLGLTIVHRLVQQHGGEVSIENSPAGGACATVRIPRRAVVAAD